MNNLYGADTLEEFLRGAEARFDDAVLLMQHERFGAAVYLFGYVAEMVVKAAGLRFFLQKGLTDPISKADRDAVANDAKSLSVSLQSSHDAVGWMNWLVKRRSANNAAYDPALEARFRRAAEDAHAFWQPELRYRDPQPSFTPRAMCERSTPRFGGCCPITIACSRRSLPMLRTPQSAAPSWLSSAERTKLLDQLCEELVRYDWNRVTPMRDPTLVVEYAGRPGQQRLLVVWSGWRGLSLGERRELVLEAVRRVGGRNQIPVESDLASALGLTWLDAAATRALPFLVAAAPPNPAVSAEAMAQALQAVGAVRVLEETREDLYLLRFATREEADRTVRLLHQRLPSVNWMVLEPQLNGPLAF